MGHIFISYSHKDTGYAHLIADTLTGKGFEVWIDERLDYGSQWPHEIQKQLDSCSAFILIMSPRSYSSEWVQSELQRAKRKQKTIFPLLLEGEETWLSVESTQYFDVRNGNIPDGKFFNALWNAAQSSGGYQPQTFPPTAGSERVRTKWRFTPRTLAGLIIIITLCLCGTVLAGYYSLPKIMSLVSSALPTESTSGAGPSKSPVPPAVEAVLPTIALQQGATPASGLQFPTQVPGPDTYINNFQVINDEAGQLYFTVDYNYNGDSGDVLYSAGCIYQGQQKDCVDLGSGNFAPHPGPSRGKLEFRLGVYGTDPLTTDQIYVGIYTWGPSTLISYEVFDYVKQWTFGLPTPTMVK